VRKLATKSYRENDQGAAISSGSFVTLGMVVAPCSMKTLAAIALGHNEDLLHRARTWCEGAAAVWCCACARRPFNDIHLEHMLKLSRMGVVIAPPLPAFYNGPRSPRRRRSTTASAACSTCSTSTWTWRALGRSDGRRAGKRVVRVEALAQQQPRAERYSTRAEALLVRYGTGLRASGKPDWAAWPVRGGGHPAGAPATLKHHFKQLVPERVERVTAQRRRTGAHGSSVDRVSYLFIICD
jgi:hypothetical protein